MALFTGTPSSETIDIRFEPLGPNETAHSVLAGAGHDTVLGSAFTDVVQGQDGNDTIYGFDGNDILVGGNGSDELQGGNGADSLFGGADADLLWGGSGDDIMYGGTGNDTYFHFAGDGIDTINDNKSESGTPGYGGGNDTLQFGVTYADLVLYRPAGSNNLWVTSGTDLSDGYFNDGIIIEDFFLGGNYAIETLITADNAYIELTAYL